MITTVIFDFDGTLVNTNQLIINSFQHIYKKYHGKEKSVEYITSSFGEPLKSTLDREFTQPYEEVVKEYRYYQLEKFEKEIKLFDHVRETLEKLKDKNIKMGIVTSRFRHTTELALKIFNIQDFFEVIVPADEVIEHKPHPEPLMKALKYIGSKPEETLLVGDSKFDIGCAINSGAIPVLVGWHDNVESIKNMFNLKYVINDMLDVINIIEVLNKEHCR